MAQFILSIPALEANAAILHDVRTAADCRILLALKGFSCWRTFPVLREYLDGCCASGAWEARLARDYFGKAIASYAPAYTEDEIDFLLSCSTHLDFNSLSQWRRFRSRVMAHPRYQRGELHCGLRINPEHSTGSTALYDPCAPGSRLGIPADELAGADLDGLSGMHFHTLCEQPVDDLETTLDAVEAKFGHWLRSASFTYLNLGGGHWITKPSYDRERLVRRIRETREKYDVEVWLEPGEAVAIHTGVLRAQVLDVFESLGHRHAILDVSATAHMPDVLEMPYRPDVFLVSQPDPSQGRADATRPAVTLAGEGYLRATEPSSGEPESGSIYRLGGPTCLAGDVIGDYVFPRPLEPGDVLVLDDMAHYTMVKTTTFNGVPHPAIVLQHPGGRLETVREFDYHDFMSRLG